MQTRHVMRGWLFKRAVLQVADNEVYHEGNGIYRLYGPWRDATAADLAKLREIKRNEEALVRSDKRFLQGQRVKATRGNFHQNAEGVVVFQEPHGGRVWVQRDGTDSPVYYYAIELEHWFETKSEESEEACDG